MALTAHVDQLAVRMDDLTGAVRSLTDDGRPVYLVAEVSAGVGTGDVERAHERASLLAKTGVRTLPVVAGSRIGTEAEHLADRSGVWRLMDGSARPPAS